MHLHAMPCGQFCHDLVQSQIPFDRQPLSQPTVERRELAFGMVALRLRSKPATLALEDHHVVHKTRRHPEVPGRLAMPMPFLNKGDHTTA